MWAAKFQSRAQIIGYDGILDGTIKVDKNYKASVLINNHGYHDLLTVCEGEVSFGLVQSSKSVEHPNGDLCVSLKNLVGIYNPYSGTSTVFIEK